MQAARLSKSSVKWEPGYRVAWRFADDRFAVADWHCNGTGSIAPPADEFTRHFEINLHRRGWHIRSVARHRYFIDPLHHSLWPADSGFRLSNNTAQPQAATLLFVAQDLIEESIATIDGAGAAALRQLRTSPAHWRSSELTACHARLLATHPEDRLALEEHSLALIRRVVAEAAGAGEVGVRTQSARRAAAVDKARSYILSRYREALSVSSIAAASGIAPSTLCESFPQAVGMPVWRYVQRLRMEDAALALGEGVTDLSRLALDLGFSSHSHFTQAFRAHFGATPSGFSQTLYSSRSARTPSGCGSTRSSPLRPRTRARALPC
jgi:AraC-like DNA-binding protein